MLSASTAGSVPELAADRTRAATALARSMVQKDCLNNEISVEGEIQIDAALSPDSYSVRVHRNSMLQPSDVWVFPTLDAADISKAALHDALRIQLWPHSGRAALPDCPAPAADG